MATSHPHPLKAEPAIADRLTLIWIGGSEHAGLAYVPARACTFECNMALV
ncbi:Twin-arginine translocation pathway signal, partial [human gut metagenome]